MLAPNVKMAAVLRSLITMAETLRGTMHQRDAVTGDVIVDLKSTEVYLKVLSQITATYKMDAGKLLFSSSGLGGASSGASGDRSAGGQQQNQHGGAGGGGHHGRPD
jgi:hypothetical protein